MGLWETLDIACAALCEAGYPDPWSWTPRQIMHRLAVHQQLKNADTLRQLNVEVLGSRGEEKAIKEFVTSLSGSHATQGEDADIERRPAPPAVVEKLEQQMAKLPWTNR